MPFPFLSHLHHIPLYHSFLPEKGFSSKEASCLKAKSNKIVLTNILPSNASDRFSTYSLSNANFFSQGNVVRPLTWVNPVIPGLTLCRWRCFSVKSGRYSGNNGRGPISDMSPF